VIHSVAVTWKRGWLLGCFESLDEILFVFGVGGKDCSGD
jgi:hypothetical protein